MLESFRLHCIDNPDIAIYTADCSKLEPGQFKEDVLAELNGYEFVLFCVDDTIFLRQFDLKRPISLLKKHPDAIGFSLRLGLNTTYCYMKDCDQKVPKFEVVDGHCIKYNWRKAQWDFGYPLEISSSIYRTDDVMGILEDCNFDNPNMLEVMLSRGRFGCRKDYLMCYPESVAVSVPFNKVQKVFPRNRSMKYTPHYFQTLYKQGMRINVEEYAGITTNSAHQELPLKLKGE
jgi:hypothetical protein